MKSHVTWTKLGAAILLVTLFAATAMSASEWGSLVDQPELDRWIDSAVKHSPVIKTARERLKAAGYSVDSARADRRPSVDVTVTARGGQKSNFTTGGATADVETFLTGARAAWDLDLFGRVRAEVGSARFAAAASEYALRDQELRLASAVVIRYLQGTYQAEQLKLQDQMVKAYETALKTMQGRNKAGLLSAPELDRGEAELNNAEKARISVREASDVLAARWVYLVSTNVPPLPSAAADTLPSLPKLPEASGLHALAVNRPDVRAAYALWQEADRKSASASRERLPSVQAVASLEEEGPSPVADPESWSAWAGIRLSLPVLAPKKGANIALKKSQSRVAWSLYEDVTKLALLDIRESYVKRLRAGEKLNSAEASAKRLESSFQSSKRKYDKGLIKSTELETARLVWLRARNTALTLKAEALERHINFVRACGGPGLKSGK